MLRKLLVVLAVLAGLLYSVSGVWAQENGIIKVEDVNHDGLFYFGPTELWVSYLGIDTTFTQVYAVDSLGTPYPLIVHDPNQSKSEKRSSQKPMDEETRKYCEWLRDKNRANRSQELSSSISAKIYARYNAGLITEEEAVYEAAEMYRHGNDLVKDVEVQIQRLRLIITWQGAEEHPEGMTFTFGPRRTVRQINEESLREYARELRITVQAGHIVVKGWGGNSVVIPRARAAEFRKQMVELRPGQVPIGLENSGVTGLFSKPIAVAEVLKQAKEGGQ